MNQYAHVSVCQPVCMHGATDRFFFRCPFVYGHAIEVFENLLIADYSCLPG